MNMSDLAPLDQAILPAGIRSRFVDGVNGLRVHILEAGFEEPGRPCVLLLHGFPELAWSWRRVIGPLAAAGFHVVAPDLRGYGRTTGWDADYDSEADLRSFRLLNAVRDALGLVVALGHRSVAAVVGHDFGSPVAAWCALVRPDVFRSVALMSAPFAGPPALPRPTPGPDIHDALAKLDRPRKHYQWYYSTRPANADMWHCRQGVHAFLRAYYHHKSADWRENKPFRLKGWTAEELAKMPTYYVMDLTETMAETVAHVMPSPAEIAACRWLPDSELAVYSAEYERTGFQGGLQWYRRGTGGLDTAELELFSGRTIDVPAVFIAGSSDWGVHQRPGAVERMQQSACTRMLGCHLLDGAGHWVQQEQWEKVSELLVGFLRGSPPAT
jgi:pimeloyl-ACP methyl ester carboxylesterase